jgi:hypothetical protein
VGTAVGRDVRPRFPGRNAPLRLPTIRSRMEGPAGPDEGQTCERRNSIERARGRMRCLAARCERMDLASRSVFALAIALVGCGGSVHANEPGDAGSDALVTVDGAGPMPDAGCPIDPGATASELAATPRANAELELLALTLGTRIVADPPTYDRVSRDMTAIRGGHPELDDVRVRFPFDQKLRVVVDSANAKPLQAGTYHAFDCINAQYGGVDQRDVTLATDGSNASTTVKFRGFFAIDRLACRYLDVPGVIQIHADVRVGDGSTVFAWTEDGSAFHYVFDRAGGDCPAGCTTHDLTHFRTDLDGSIVLVEKVSTADGSRLPSWMSHRTYVRSRCAL